MTWRDVLDAKNLAIDLVDMAELCQKLGYLFLAFNGRIYVVPDARPAPAVCFDTGLKVDSLEKNNRAG